MQYSEAISRYAEKKFQRDDVDLITSARSGIPSQLSIRILTRDSTINLESHKIPLDTYCFP